MDEHERRREQKRQAQARWRRAHADRLRAARRVAGILVRQESRSGEIKELASAIRDIAGIDFAQALGRELVRKPRKRKE
jgi:hypothetical protein